MAIATVAKVVVCLACLLVSLWGVKNTHVGHRVGHRMGHLKMRLARLFKGLGGELGFGHHGRHRHGEHFDNEPSKCHACLTSGKDFCISVNRCIPRATFQCRGPRDHITGDKEFALHGNPEGIKHSMVCPHQSHNEDCYFDEECHAKVNWGKISEVKRGFFAKLKVVKQKDAAGAVRLMMRAAHATFLEAGMPEDRIEFILEKWVKAVYPESLAPLRDEAPDEQDCFFDKDCHSRVHWEEVAKIKEGLFKRFELYQMKGDRASMNMLGSKARSMLVEAGVPDNRVDYIVSKWLKTLQEVKVQAMKAKSIFV